MNTELLSTLSLVILLLPLAGFVLQLALGRAKVPVEYAADPHESPSHDHDPSGAISMRRTADHSQEAVDLPHDATGSRPRRALPRGPWSDVDQRRALRLSWLSTAIAGATLILAVWIAATVFSTPMPRTGPNGVTPPMHRIEMLWADLGDATTSAVGRPYRIHLGLQLDDLTAIMLVVVALVSLLVHLFSGEYMRAPSMHGGRLNRYFGFLGLFTFSMLGIVLADDLLLIYIFWELVGLSSYLLIGYWYERPAPQYASMKAFLTNRIGDVGMFAGIMILYTQLGTFNLHAIYGAVAAGTLPFGSTAWLTAAGILLFCGAVGKSAQVPLNTWLPDAMEGPTPVSALIHAATMVAAGVYLTARIFPILTGDAMLVVAAVGGVTAFVAATIAMVQWDLKKVLAFSTVSQLGYMVMALGVGAYRGAIFHLVTHAMFKACLFLAAGSVIHRMHGALHEMGDHQTDPQDMRNMGGLRRKMPVTFVTCLAATLAISGVPLFSGFLSKDEILTGAWAFAELDPGWIGTALVATGYVVAAMTAYYMLRMLLLTFLGEPRVVELHDRVRESPAVMTVPLVVLAALSLWLPYSPSPLAPSERWLFGGRVQAPAIVVPEAAQLPVIARADRMTSQQRLDFQVGTLHDSGFPHVISLPALASLLVSALGIGLAWFRFGRPGAAAVSWSRPRGLERFLAARWYQDDLYERWFPVGVVRAAVKVLAWFDQNIVDGLVNAVAAAAMASARFVAAFDLHVVDGIVRFLAGTTQFLGMSMRQLQTGRVQTYIVYVVLGIVALFFAFR